MTGFKKIYSVFERKPGGGAVSVGTETTLLVHLFQPFGVEAEFLGHLDQLLRGFRILDRFGELPGSVGLVLVMVGLGHRSTFSDKYGLRQKGSTSGTRPDMAGSGTGKSARDRSDGERTKRRGNGILTRQRCRKTRPLFVL
jgi:hypothetical protein